MAIPFLHDIDLSYFEIKSAALENVTSLPAAVPAGAIAYHTGTNTVEVANGTVYEALLKGVTGAGAVSVSNATRGVPEISVAVADGSNDGLLTSAGFTLLDGATALATADTVAIRGANGSLTVGATVNPDDAASKSYVDNLAASGWSIVGTIDASTNPDYPVAVANKGYQVSVAGYIGGAPGTGVPVDVNDVVLPVQNSAGGDHPTVGADFIILQSNIDYATDSTSGYVRFATAAQVADSASRQAAGAVAVTPKMLDDVVSAELLAFGAILNTLNYSVIMPAGTASQVVNHALGQNVHVQVHDETTRMAVMTQETHTDLDNVTITLGAPHINDLLIKVIGSGATISSGSN